MFLDPFPHITFKHLLHQKVSFISINQHEKLSIHTANCQLNLAGWLSILRSEITLNIICISCVNVNKIRNKKLPPDYFMKKVL